ncbi:MAG: 4Fe-4S binding protein [Bacillota bacterium]|nr:4Fe-4S binding protein [Bacillota bacterium]
MSQPLGDPLDALERLLGRFGRPPVRFEPGRCTRARHRLSSCRACVDACPAQAIRLGAAGGPEALLVDGECCRGCGLCLPACPTAALQPAPAEAADPFQLADVTACAAVDASRLPPSARQAGCLGSLEPVALLEATARPVLLLHGDCARCPLTRGRQAFDRHLEEARELARWNGLELALTLRQEASTGLDPEGRAPRPSRAAPRLSRRDFFRLGRQEIREDAALALLPEEKPRLWSGGRLPHATDRRRRELARWLPFGPEARVSTPAGAPHPRPGLLPVWRLHLERERCPGCGLCAELCPEGALGWRLAPATGGSAPPARQAAPFPGSEPAAVPVPAELAFDLWRCAGCRLCEEACPTGALRLTQADLPLAPEPVALLGGHRARCRRCGQQFFSPRPEPLCRSCRPDAAELLEGLPEP